MSWLRRYPFNGILVRFLYVLWVCSLSIGSSSVAEENKYNFNIESIIVGSFRVGLFIEWHDDEDLGKRFVCFMIIRWPINWFVYQGHHFRYHHVSDKYHDVIFRSCSFGVLNCLTSLYLRLKFFVVEMQLKCE